EPRVAVALGEPPLDDGLAIRAAQPRHLVLVEVLAREIGEQREQRALAPAQELAERAHAEVVAGEPGLELELAVRHRVEVVVFGGEVEEMSSRHGVFSSPRTSS